MRYLGFAFGHAGTLSSPASDRSFFQLVAGHDFNFAEGKHHARYVPWSCVPRHFSKSGTDKYLGGRAASACCGHGSGMSSNDSTTRRAPRKGRFMAMTSCAVKQPDRGRAVRCHRAMSPGRRRHPDLNRPTERMTHELKRIRPSIRAQAARPLRAIKQQLARTGWRRACVAPAHEIARTLCALMTPGVNYNARHEPIKPAAKVKPLPEPD